MISFFYLHITLLLFLLIKKEVIEDQFSEKRSGDRRLNSLQNFTGCLRYAKRSFQSLSMSSVSWDKNYIFFFFYGENHPFSAARETTLRISYAGEKGWCKMRRRLATLKAFTRLELAGERQSCRTAKTCHTVVSNYIFIFY